MNSGGGRAGLHEFEALYIEHRSRLFAFLVYRTGDRALAEDLLGDVFERAFRSRARFDPDRGSQTTWLYAIAINRLRDHHRRASVERLALERVHRTTCSSIPPPQDAIPERDRVMNAVSLLPPRDREIIALRFGADLTVPQIARLTNQRLPTIEGRLFRVLHKLADILGPDAPLASHLASGPAEDISPSEDVSPSPTIARTAT